MGISYSTYVFYGISSTEEIRPADLARKLGLPDSVKEYEDDDEVFEIEDYDEVEVPDFETCVFGNFVTGPTLVFIAPDSHIIDFSIGGQAESLRLDETGVPSDELVSALSEYAKILGWEQPCWQVAGCVG